MDRQRIDKWLWHARVVRTRTVAAALADTGMVRVNGARIDASSKTIRAGDVVTIAFDHVRVLKVLDFCERRGSADIARALFKDLSPPVPARKPEEPDTGRESGTGRPTKRDRRAIDKLRWDS